MARVAFATRGIDEAGNATGGSGYQARVFDDFYCTVATVVSDDSAGGTTIAQPITPNAGTQTTLAVTTAAVDTTITVASTTGFALGQLITVYDATNTVYRFIRAILAGPPRLTLESAIGFIFSNANTTVGNLDQIGVIAGWVPDTSYHYLQITEVASGRKMPPTLIPTMIGTLNVGVLEEGAGGGTRPTINFKGTAITAVDNGGASRVDVTVGGDFSDQAFIRVGTNAASSGVVRIPSATNIVARNNANNGDVNILGTNASDNVLIRQGSGQVTVGDGFLSVGPTPAVTGVIRIPNNSALKARNAANTADHTIAIIDAGDQLSLGPSTAVRFDSGVVIIGTNPAAAGMVRLPTSPTISNRNAGNTADEQIWPLLTASAQLGADVTMTVANTWYDGPSISCAPGVWLINAGITAEITGGTNTTRDFEGRLWDGTTTFQSGEQQSFYGTAGAAPALQVALSAIRTFASTTTVKISGATSVAGTIKAATPINGVGNNASWIHAVRIG